ncbi:hypothetical protein ACLI09_06265 [Flavobacterium sp. RHBU_24]|uniref:hypothetical protein n=1 Tax=Flavobacterium sp. RHBU_24 TaxID=3391185 RepID=UPI00398533D0
MNDLKENLPLIASCVLASLICIAITRAIFSIPKFLKYQKAQTLAILKIAELKGVDSDSIQKIIDVIEERPTGNYVGDEKNIRQIYKKL